MPEPSGIVSVELIVKEQDLRRLATAAGLKYRVTSWERTPMQQAALFAQGRYDARIINMYRRVAGMQELRNAAELKAVVTKTLASKHLLGEAFDVVLFDKVGKPHYSLKVNMNNNMMDDYEELAALGRKVGLKPGWDFGDPPHYEL